MPTDSIEQFKFDEYMNLSYKRTTTTTDNSGVVTGVSVFRSVYPPTTDVADVPASVQAQCTLEWTAAIKNSWNEYQLSVNPPPPPEGNS